MSPPPVTAGWPDVKPLSPAQWLPKPATSQFPEKGRSLARIVVPATALRGERDGGRWARQNLVAVLRRGAGIFTGANGGNEGGPMRTHTSPLGCLVVNPS